MPSGPGSQHATRRPIGSESANSALASDSLTTITFNYFKLFPGAKELTVNVVGAKGQSSYEVSRDKPTLDLAGVM